MKLSERIQINDDRNELTLDGFVFDGDFLAKFFFTPSENWVRVAKVDLENKMLYLAHKTGEPPNEA